MGKIIENYSLQQELGSGVYSRVYKAINTKTKQQVAIKMVKAEKFKELPKLQEGTVNEINILSNLEFCPHIIRYFDMLKTVNNFYFVYEYCNGGNLESLLKKQGPLSEKQALTYFSQILEAFKVLNKNNIMHRDLKPDNILIHDGILKLADFGFCKPLQNQNQTTQTMLGSPIYMAPQILKGQTYTMKADIWSLGVVLFRMLYGFCPFQSNNIGKLIMIIEQEQMKIPSQPQVSFKVKNLLKKMITKDPKQRADWADIFAYEIKNGEIISSHIYDKNHSKNLKDSGLKGSQSPSHDSGNHTKISHTQSTSYSSRQFGKHKNESDFQTSTYTGSGPSSALDNSLKNEKKFTQKAYHIRDDKMRNTYTTKSPLRENLRKDMILKSHNKCLELTSVVVSLCSNYQNKQSLGLGYLFLENIQKQLYGIFESIKKEIDSRVTEDSFLKNFYFIVQGEMRQARKNLNLMEDQLKNFWDMKVEGIESNKRRHLKAFLNSLKLENISELVLASQIIDLVEESLVIRKETYEKMSKEQLQKKVKQKIQF